LISNWKMRDWPDVDATLIEGSLTVVNGSDSRWEPGIHYRADYLFSYSWQGHTYYVREQSFIKMSGSDLKFWEFRNPVGI